MEKTLKAVLAGSTALIGSYLGMVVWMEGYTGLTSENRERASFIAIAYCGVGAAVGAAGATLLTVGTTQKTLRQLQRRDDLTLDERATLMNLQERMK